MGIHLGRIFIAQEGNCFHCGRTMGLRPDNPNKQRKGGGWTREHIVPTSHLRKKKIKLKYNIVLAHAQCNRDKANKFPTQQEVIKFKGIYNKVLNLQGLRGTK